MPAKIVEVPGLGNVEFPDTMSDEEIAGHIKKQVGTKSTGRQFLDAGVDFLSGVGGDVLNTVKGISNVAERGSRMGAPGGPIEKAWESPRGQKLTEELPSLAGKAGR